MTVYSGNVADGIIIDGNATAENELSAITVALSSTDTGSLVSSTDISSAINPTLITTDAGTFITSTDISSIIIGSSARIDTGAFSSTDISSTIFSVISSSDAGTFVSSTDVSSVIYSILSSIDTGSLVTSIDQGSTIISSSISIDSGTLGTSTDTSSIINAVGSSSDAGTFVTSTDIPSIIPVFLSSADAGSLVTSTDISSLSNPLVYANDSGSLTVTEVSVSGNYSITSIDGGSLTVSDVSAFTLSSTDTGVFVATEVSALYIPVVISATDFGNVTLLAEFSGLIIVPSRQDAGTFDVIESNESLIIVNVNDNANLTIQDNSFRNVIFSSSDTGTISSLNTSNSLLIVPVFDTSILLVTELSASPLFVDVIDSGTFVVAEQSDIIAMAISTDAGTVSGTTNITPQLLTVVSTGDIGYISVVETVLFIRSISSSDIGSFVTSTDTPDLEGPRSAIDAGILGLSVEIANVIKVASGVTNLLTLRDNPYAAYYIGSSDISYLDITGNGNSATSSPALPVSTSFITSHSPAPAVIGGIANLVIPYNRFAPGWENASFTLECWYDSLTTGAMGIMSHLGKTDGIYFDGNNITFGVDMYTDPSLTTVNRIRASWPIPDFKSANHIVGVYDTSKIYLYVDRILRAQVDIPNAQKANGFVTLSDTKLYCGESVNGQKALFDAPAVYSHTLSSGIIKSHFSSGRSAVKSRDIATRRGATLWKFDDSHRNLAPSHIMPFNKGRHIGTIVREGLRPGLDNSLLSLVNCTWQTMISTQSVGIGNTAGIKLSWDGDGNFTVESSLDMGVTWVAAINGGLIAGTIGTPATNVVDVRIKFAGGVTGDISVVRNISVVSYRDGVVTGTDRSRALTLVGNVTTSDQDTEPIQRYANAGANLSSGGHMILGPDNESVPKTINSIEMFTTFSTTTPGQYILDLRSSQTTYLWLNGTSGLSFVGLATLYINGIAYTTGAFSPVAGQEYHIMAVLSTPLAATAGAVIGADNTHASSMTGRVSLVATYPSVITDAYTIYNSYDGIPRIRIVDSGSISIRESIAPTKSYVDTWSVSAGT